MSGISGHPDVQRLLIEAGVRVRRRAVSRLAPAEEFGVTRARWVAAAVAMRAARQRLSSLWVEEHGNSLLVTALFEHGGVYTALRTRTRTSAASVPSIAPVHVAANRLERHARDLFGIVFEGHPDNRRWVRHQAWQAGEFPLRRTFPVQGSPHTPTPPDRDYPYAMASGAGVYEIPVGPVHAGTIEPGHFRFQAVGEQVLNLELRLGYVHKGIEKIARGRDPASLTRLAARVSGDSAVAHAWAACMAMERAAGVTPPARALALRGVLAEIERVVSHLWDIAGICNDVGFAFAFFQFGRLVEDWRRVNAAVFAHRLLMDTLVPGGVAADVDADAVSRLLTQCAATRHELVELWGIIQYSASLHDRLDGTGVLSGDDAEAFGALGYVGRASGQDFDVRRDAPYAPYDELHVEAPCVPFGDVAARARIRRDEALVSLALIERLLANLPAGAVRTEFVPPAPGSEGLGIVDGWRGEIVTHVRFDAEGRIARFFPRDPSWLNWPTMERLIHGNIVPDFPVCNKSVNGSYSGHDL